MLRPGASQAVDATIHNCPQPGKWAISVWDGADGTDTGQALAACGENAVDVAYYIDPDTQQWLGYFVGHAEISTLLTLDNRQGVIALGGTAVPTVTPVPSLTPTPAFTIHFINVGQGDATLIEADGKVDVLDILVLSVVGLTQCK
jgi:hypothetical protein